MRLLHMRLHVTVYMVMYVRIWCMLACVPMNTYLSVVARFICESLNVNMFLRVRGLLVSTACAGS